MAVDDLVQRRPRSLTRPPATGTVSSVDDDGVYVTVLDGDTRAPHGPCYGGTRPVLVDGELTTEPLPVGTLVLLVHTDSGPWIAAWEGA
ncbi:MAG TPA: hypothetical protein VMF51_18300 [Nocardioides sp.]|uniref:hypothetical protein n=1 Tax=Nocardioides sp. TaxID=35761 RepID=UPI002CAD6997|nr:hypothetical protein [Nocardioides sp.]HTW17088.1 hypothetical protein [Nocardioides sp.]